MGKGSEKEWSPGPLVKINCLFTELRQGGKEKVNVERRCQTINTSNSLKYV